MKDLGKNGARARLRIQQRAVVTRRQLVRAARQSFAKDGFEQASIEGIASKAGKTRGAFYSNFKDKEDVFFAIFEEDLRRDQQKIGQLLSRSLTTEQRVEVLSKHLATFLHNPQRGLLYLEFKMYAIRHPHKRKRLAELHAAMCIRCWMTDVFQLLPELRKASTAAKRKQSLQLAAAMDGLALNLLFDPGTLDEERLLRSLRMNLRDAMR